LGPNILLSTLFWNIVNLCSSLNVRDQVSHPYKTTSRSKSGHKKKHGRGPQVWPAWCKAIIKQQRECTNIIIHAHFFQSGTSCHTAPVFLLLGLDACAEASSHNFVIGWPQFLSIWFVSMLSTSTVTETFSL
jgi:hypothetical protein